MAFALGFHTLAIGPEESIFGADRVAALSENDGQGFCPGAMLALADHALGAGVVRSNQGVSTSTIDLRMEWVAKPPLVGDIRAISHSLPPYNGIAFVKARLEGQGGVFAHARGAFAAGMLPGGESMTTKAQGLKWQRVEAPDFRSFAGIEWWDDRLVLPASAHVIGAVQLPAFHGGVIAGAMQIAAQDNALRWADDAVAVSMTMRFLRPAVALGPVVISCEPERIGKRMATLRGTARQDGRIVAAGEYVFWREATGSGR